MRRLLVLLLVVAVGIWAYRWWETRPLPEPPETIWVRQPFRGPDVFAEAGKYPALDFTLAPITPDPLLEAPQTEPDPRVALRRPSTTAIRLAEYLSWRKPFTSIPEMSPADLVPWNLRWYVRTGETTMVGSRRWAQYRREDAKPREDR